jgi:hypothetical protein
MLTLTGRWRLEFGSKKIDEDPVLQGLAAPMSNGIKAIRGKILTDPRTYQQWMTWALSFPEKSESN